MCEDEFTTHFELKIGIQIAFERERRENKKKKIKTLIGLASSISAHLPSPPPPRATSPTPLLAHCLTASRPHSPACSARASLFPGRLPCGTCLPAAVDQLRAARSTGSLLTCGALPSYALTGSPSLRRTRTRSAEIDGGMRDDRAWSLGSTRSWTPR
jgi:hypothetical protein